MPDQPFYAVRVVVAYVDGATSTRDYVRGQTRMGKDKFAAWALGDMIALVTDPGEPITWRIQEVDFDTVVENRKFHHTTHNSAGVSQ